MKIKVSLIVFTAFLVFLSTDCKKEEPVKLIVVSTSPVTDITTTTATSGGTLTFAGKAEIFTNGVCWSTTGYPSTSDTKTVDRIGNPQFESSLSGLIPGTIYYIRAYAINSAGTAYGAELPFTTLGGSPDATTMSATNVSLTGATLNGTVNANDLSTTVTFEYGTSASYGQEVTAEQSPVTGNEGTNVSATLTGLADGTYHFRLKAVNSLGTFYGGDLEFSICSQVPTVTTLAATNISATGVTLNGTVNANGFLTTVVFQYSLAGRGGPSWKTITSAESPVTGNGITNVSANISGLGSGTTHRFHVKATNSCGSVTGDNIQFTLLPPCPQVPTVTTLAATNISTAGVTLNGSVNANGSPTTVTFQYSVNGGRGITWVTVTALESPVTENGITNVSVNISGLRSGTTHQFKVIATNSCGTITGENMSFTIP